jgi:4'-phosphopantetheinyl transferase
MMIYTFSIHESISEETISKWLTYVTSERREQLIRFRFREDFLRSLVGEAMVRTIISEKVGIAPEILKIARTEQSKPFLQDYPDVHFNISHSGDWVVCAISDDAVGIDIEEIKLDIIKPALIKKVLNEKEQKYFQTLSDEEKNIAFYRFWTLKEAYTKCIGRGLGIELNSINIDTRIDSFGQSSLRLTTEGQEWGGLMRSIDFCDGYMLSICATKFDENHEIRSWMP